jgi:Tfp pilus assembly protein PilV
MPGIPGDGFRAESKKPSVGAHSGRRTRRRVGSRNHRVVVEVRRGRKPRQSGLSLAEVLVSSVIALIGIGALLSAFLTGRFAAEGSKHWTEAMNVASARVEHLKSLPYRDLSSMPAVTTEGGLVLDQAPNGNFVPCDRVTTLTREDEGITIAVEVSWRERRAKSGSGSALLAFDLRTWVTQPGRSPAP